MRWAILIILREIWSEGREWMPYLARRVIERAVKLLPASKQQRMLEEWGVEVSLIPGKISPLIFALSIWWGYYRIKALGEVDFYAARKIVRIFDFSLSLFTFFCIIWVVYPILIGQRLTLGGASSICRFRCRGKNGTELLYPVFRTFRPGAVRPTRFGKFLLMTRLHRLPALTQVLAGNMSLVGPPITSPRSPASERGDLAPGLCWVDSSELSDLYGKSAWHTSRIYVQAVSSGLRSLLFRSGKPSQ